MRSILLIFTALTFTLSAQSSPSGLSVMEDKCIDKMSEEAVILDKITDRASEAEKEYPKIVESIDRLNKYPEECKKMYGYHLIMSDAIFLRGSNLCNQNRYEEGNEDLYLVYRNCDAFYNSAERDKLDTIKGKFLWFSVMAKEKAKSCHPPKGSTTV